MARQRQRDVGERVLQPVGAAAEVVELVDEVEEREQRKEAEQHEHHAERDLAGEVAPDDGQGALPAAAGGAARRGQGGHSRTSEVRRQKSHAAIASTTAWVASSPAANDSLPCATQA